jgi:hypothetical protein
LESFLYNFFLNKIRGKEDKMNWILIGLLVVAVFLFLKYRELKHKFSFVAILILLLLLGSSFWNVHQSNSLNLGSFDGFVKAGKIYFTWLGGVFGNAKTLTAYAVKQDWGIGNSGGDVASTAANITNSLDISSVSK